MTSGFIFAQFLTGLSSASSLFLVASGLSLIFGVTRIVNFAHGSFYMLGAYVAYHLIEWLPTGILPFWGSVICAALVVGVVGVIVEIVILRRIYHAPELFQLVATFGIVLVMQDTILALFGGEDKFGSRAPGLKGVVRIFGEPIPQYDLLLIGLGPVVLLVVWLLLNKTRWGTLVRAATQDRDMVAALGVNQAWLFTSVFFLGSALAGLGGAVQVPRESINLLMDLSIIAEAFVVVVIGGMGSIVGAFLAAVLIAELNAFGILIMPQITIVLAFLVMAVVLVVRPWGLLGKPDVIQHAGDQIDMPLREAGWAGKVIGLLVVAALIAVPYLLDDFGIVLATDIIIFALFAASLHFLMGNSGMVSFGHAAYFALGAYASALVFRHLNGSMELALLLGPIAALVGALVFGWFCVRLSGVYLAMLTLAAAQIVWSVTYSWGDVTGGDDGMLGIWPAEWARSKHAFYYLTLALCGGGVLILRKITHAPFGYVLRGGRDSSVRTESIGIHLLRHRHLGFAVAGLFAGVAGSIYVFSKGSIFPDEAAIPRSIDGLVMVLLGGVHTLAGPLVGAGVFRLLEDQISRLDFWRAILGAIIILLVVVAPQGVAGFFHTLAIRIGLAKGRESA
ncbi:ABC transporter permease [Chromatiales bacterium (ex Bugula neritina AB1)]|nr:ABC transporter permease [Chromatiales bacterium (ex Bugula neritina AB1)]